ncbi:ROK family protein [Natronincola ferrireducens]|uniref:ROK family protein (Putative glucokinase) n=1 Tax=Natronincola ferrireducens TaxID=393762 RepID=A0A1G9A6E6_9FIRM|nr:ROK family protein [Natronincola ferrireducens]SDK22863.1 ROK family protein (putative glucokinase) [Natronincola ferrireducens]
MILCTFDIGGTTIKYGIVTQLGEVIIKSQMDTEARYGGGAIINKIIEKTKELKNHYDIDGIAISSAGQIDNKEGKVIFATNTIPNYTGTPIKEILEQQLGLPVTVENDVNCTALGEYWQGAGKNAEEFIALTLGTGIGGAIVIDGKIYSGAYFSAGEFGHMNLYPDGLRCPCGNKGCYEMYASSKALANKIKKVYGEEVDTFDVFRLAKEGNISANEMIDGWVQDMALGLQSIVHIFNPGLIIIGGGISEQGNFLLEKIQWQLKKIIMPPFKEKLSIKMAVKGNEANLLGAAYYFINQMN